MSASKSSALLDWSKLPASARALREKHESGDKLCDVIYILDPRRIAREVQAIPETETPGSGRLRNATYRGIVARIYVSYPRDGAGKLSILAMVDQGTDQGMGYFSGYACGGGYDKLTAALVGCPLPTHSITLGDHCDPEKRPTLDMLQEHGLIVVGK